MSAVARRWGWPPCDHAACAEHGPAAIVLRGARACSRCGARTLLQAEFVVHYSAGGLLCRDNMVAVCEPCSLKQS